MAIEADEMTMEPSHPGEILRETINPALGMTIKDVAAHLGVSRAALSELVNERRSVSLDMARRLGAAFGTAPGSGSPCRCSTTCGMPSTRNRPRGSPSSR